MSADWLGRLHQATRPIITLLFAAAVIAGFFLGRINGETFIGIAGPVVAFWFAQRAHDRRGTDPGG
jgi:hypothetical protein